MKRKTFLLLISFVVAVSSFARATFTCSQIIEDFKEFEPYVSENSISESAAKKMFENHKVSKRGFLEHTYIISSSEDLNINNLIDVTREWMRNSSTYGVIITEVNRTENYIEASIDLGMLAGKFGGTKLSLTHTDLTLRISFKQNRIKFNIFADKYKVLVLSDAKPITRHFFVKDVFPYEKEKDHAALFAKSFIRVNTISNEFAYNYLKFLNEEWDGQGIEEDDW